MKPRRHLILAGIAAFAVSAALAVSPPASAKSPRTFLASVHVNPNHTATFPLHHGVTTDGRDVSFVIIDASNSNGAARFGVNVSQKLQHVRGTTAVMSVTEHSGMLVFPATVDFRPQRIVAGTPGVGFPPTAAQPGSIGETGYSPLIELPDGTVLNAPQIANATGVHDKVSRLDPLAGTVDLRLTDGFARGEKVLYLSTRRGDVRAGARRSSDRWRGRDRPGTGVAGRVRQRADRCSQPAAAGTQLGVARRG
jgi:hypothetical protein